MQERSEAVLSPGALFHGVYEVRRCLDAGGMAIVYEAVHAFTRRPCALKVLRPLISSEPGMRERFALEARIPAEVRGEHIVEVLDAGFDDATGSAFLVMELLRGDDLEAVLRRRGRLASAEVLALLRQAALALDATHAARIVHRDLKPSNLFLAEGASAPPTLKILDFGIAKIADGSGATTRNLGTPKYMSPEQVRGDADVGPASDVYALGHVAFALLVGIPYWQEESAAGGRLLFDRIEAGATESASARSARHGVALPDGFDAWFERATAREPEDRFASASALVEALAAVTGSAPHADARASASKQAIAFTVRHSTEAPARRSRVRSAAALVVIGLVGGAWLVARQVGVAGAPSPHSLAVPATPTPSPQAAPAATEPEVTREASLAVTGSSSAASAATVLPQPRVARAHPPPLTPPGVPPAASALASPRPPASASSSPFGPGAF